MHTIINALPFWLIVVILTLLFFSFYFFVHFLISRYCPSFFQDSEQGQVAGVLIQTISIFYGILLGFIIVVLWQDFERIQRIVVAEGSNLVMIIRDSGVFPMKEQNLVKQAVGAYIQAIYQDDWKTMRQGALSQQANWAFSNLFSTIQALKVNTEKEKIFYGEMVNKLNELVEARRDRRYTVNHNTPRPLVIILIFGAVLVLALNPTLAKGVTNTSYLHTSNLLISILIAFNLALIFVLRHPFSGDWQISNKTFSEGVLQQLKPLNKQASQLNSPPLPEIIQ